MAMSDQHQAIDELLERLLPLLVMVRNNPDTLPDVGGEMCTITESARRNLSVRICRWKKR